MRRFDALREANAEKIAALTSAENGSAGWFTLAGQPGLMRQANAYLKAAEELGWEEPLVPADPDSSVRSVVRRGAAGAVAAVIPWNSPFPAATAKIIPALFAGNPVALKVSPDNSLSMGLPADLLEQTGLPKGVVSVLPADRETSEYLVSHPDVDKIAFTGSMRAGRRIASIAGEQLKRVGLELGGKSAAVIVPDADAAGAVQGLKFGSLLNHGEACIAQTRILAPRSRYEEVISALKEMVESLKVGDPDAPDTFTQPGRPDDDDSGALAAAWGEFVAVAVRDRREPGRGPDGETVGLVDRLERVAIPRSVRGDIHSFPGLQSVILPERLEPQLHMLLAVVLHQ